MANPTRFGLDLPAATSQGSETYIRDMLDPQIEELQDQLSLLQGLRRAVCGTFQIDRREDASVIGKALDAANRAVLEGEEDRRVPRRVPIHTHVDIRS